MKPLEEKNYQLTEKDALSIYAKMMHTLDSSEFESFLSEDFIYSSQKVLTDMNSKDEFIEYIRRKLKTIKKLTVLFAFKNHQQGKTNKHQTPIN